MGDDIATAFYQKYEPKDVLGRGASSTVRNIIVVTHSNLEIASCCLTSIDNPLNIKVLIIKKAEMKLIPMLLFFRSYF